MAVEGHSRVHTHAPSSRRRSTDPSGWPLAINTPNPRAQLKEPAGQGGNLGAAHAAWNITTAGVGPVRSGFCQRNARSRSGPLFRTSARGEVQVRSVLSDLRSRGGQVRSGFPNLQPYGRLWNLILLADDPLVTAPLAARIPKGGGAHPTDQVFGRKPGRVKGRI